jgi:negative regulator of flagellin synthesis FlgM
MKISQSQVQSVIKAYASTGGTRAKPTAERSADPRGDALVLSPQAQEILSLKERLAQVPEVRSEKVAELRAAIDRGTYKVSGREVAEKILARAIVDELV